MPYRASDEKAEGVVITYEDVTERRSTAEALSAAKRQAELASVAKSRFLAAASHDLRQPLQTLALLQGLLAKKVVGEKAQKLVGGIDEALSAMTGMLNTLLDINQIEAGSVKPEKADFPVNDLFDRLRDELTYHAQAAGLALRVVPCALSIRSDLRLLEQMIRNLISNALKYTHSGKVLVGCRCRQGNLRIEIWDTGIGIPESELQAIFEEYHQVDNAARQRSRGLGLGLSIVKSLGELLGHPISVRSLHGKGSVFSIEVPLTPSGVPTAPGHRSRPTDEAPAQTARHAGAILVIEDDPEVREHLKLFLNEEGYAISTAVDGPAALEAVARGIDATRSRPCRLQSAQWYERRSSVAEAEAGARETNAVHHSHRRYFDGDPARYRPSRLPSSQQARQARRVDARDRETPDPTARPARRTYSPSSCRAERFGRSQNHRRRR